jgi:hypothetical protein
MRRTLLALCLITCAKTAAPANPSSAPGAGAGTADGGEAAAQHDAGTGTNSDAGVQAPDGGAPADAGSLTDGTFCAPDEGEGPGPLDEAEPGLSSDCGPLAFAAPGAPWVERRDQGMEFGCERATSDAAGTLALASWSNNGATGRRNTDAWELLNPNGGSVGFVEGDFAQPLAHGLATMDRVDDPGVASSCSLRFSFDSGPPLVQNNTLQISGDPQAGVVAVEVPWNLEQFWITVHRFGEDGAPTAPPSDILEGPLAWMPKIYAVALVPDGTSLVVFSGEPNDPQGLYALWLDADGARASQTLPVGALTGKELVAQALLDGSVAVRVDGRWVSRVRKTGAEHPPAWLASLTGHDVLRLAHGYAVPFVYPSFSVGCATAVELRAPAGNLCRRVGFSETFWRADVGADGTLILLSPNNVADYPDMRCTYRAWTGLFR